jgi:hypothetical protein
MQKTKEKKQSGTKEKSGQETDKRGKRGKVVVTDGETIYDYDELYSLLGRV